MEDHKQATDGHDPQNPALQANTGVASSSNMNTQNNASKLLQLNQNRFEDYLVQALNESLMKKSKWMPIRSYLFRRHQMSQI